MTQEQINKAFRSSLGSQCNSLFTTSDDTIFVRLEEAIYHITFKGLVDPTIMQWFPEEEEQTPATYFTPTDILPDDSLFLDETGPISDTSSDFSSNSSSDSSSVDFGGGDFGGGGAGSDF